MSFTIDLLDPATRPKAPPIEGATHAHRLQGRRLAMIHEMHLRQMAHVRHVMEQVAAGEARVAALDEALSDLDMRHNYRVFGNVCGRECGMLSAHHGIEDRYLFPALAAQDNDGLRKVVDRLVAEHGIVHDYIEKMEVAAGAAIEAPGPQTFADLREAFERLEKFVISHFGYEQEELEEALGFYEIDL
ncbi:hemerythrin domain-containing protein [Mesorhizobium sp. CAU 1741]|uniref:hemerythrin domain-containing protein n=1 Tax=Mesorhizobium sp. CAU 1741 TaxID=3140366 RepID=UPI00325C1A36